jgi:phosphoribosylcarboxyaminoimidazole (NCAIR) mutase
VPRFSRSIIEPARPQTPANAEISGAHQRPAQNKGREATESVGTNFHLQPAYGAAHMSNETAAQASGIPVIHGQEDVKS